MSDFRTRADWQRLAGQLTLRNQAFIDGRYVDAVSGKTFDCISPIDGRVLTRVAEGDAEDIDRAVKAARAAFEDRRWAGQSPAARKQALLRFADAIDAHREELALLETLDMGKPIGDSLNIDIANSAGTLRWYAEAIDKVYGELAPTGDAAIAMITREPLGVVGVVVPWNFPLMMAAWKLGPALATGNSVVLKPAEQSPLTAIRVAELAVEAGIPEGVFNVVPGFGPGAGKALGLHGDVDAVAFTGSTPVGKLFMQYAGQSNLKRVGLECGGKSPHIILADCPDIDAAVEAAAAGIFFNQGEMCTAGSRLLVEESIRAAVVEKLADHRSTWQPGDPLDPATRLGAMVDERQMRQVLDYIASGREQGARLAFGGERVRTETGGYYVEPTVFDGVGPGIRIAREEIFGPVLSVIPVKDVEDAVRVANDSEYGLAAAVWSRDINTAHKVARRLRSGMVYVNCYDADDITVPFGGFKQSGIGRDKSLHALEKYTELKTTWVRLY
jgi:acyl-CoA reductase-like NAD-dependent aldehyde dehydrogenase